MSYSTSNSNSYGSGFFFLTGCFIYILCSMEKDRYHKAKYLTKIFMKNIEMNQLLACLHFLILSQ